jgi:hypothetical protein
MGCGHPASQHDADGESCRLCDCNLYVAVDEDEDEVESVDELDLGSDER